MFKENVLNELKLREESWRRTYVVIIGKEVNDDE